MNKKQLRRDMRQKRDALPQSQHQARAQALMEQLEALPAYQNAGTVCAYYPIGSEIPLLPLLTRAMAQGKRVALPKCINKELYFYCVSDLTRLTPGYGNIPEPIGDEPPVADPHALVILPGLAFDLQGNRLGYGGGCYDRFLAREPEHPTVALYYDFQLLPELEHDAHDIPAQRVLWA